MTFVNFHHILTKLSSDDVITKKLNFIISRVLVSSLTVVCYLTNLLNHVTFFAQDEVRVNAGAALGALCQVLSEAEVKTLLKDSLLGKAGYRVSVLFKKG